MKRLALLLCALLLVSCAGKNNRFADGITQAKKNRPNVYIYPLTEVARDKKLGVLPFRVPENIAASKGEGVALIFKDMLLRRRAFRVVAGLAGHYEDIGGAVEMGRKAGMDYVLAGEVLHAMEGTEFGGARLAVAVRLVKVDGGHTLWYLEQSVDQPLRYPKVDMFHRLLGVFSPPPVRRPQGAPALPNMVAGIAEDMAAIIGGGRYISSL